MKLFLFFVTLLNPVFLVAQGPLDTPKVAPNAALNRPGQPPPTKITWEQNPSRFNTPEFGETFPVSFVGTNRTEQKLSIVGVRPDCTSCINLRVSQHVIEPGQTVTISGDVILKTSGRQSGRIAVLYEGVEMPDILFYQVSYPVPYQLSNSSLVWLDGREPKSVTLKLNSAIGMAYEGVKLDEELFTASVEEQTPDSVVLSVTPKFSGRIRDALYIVLRHTDPKNPNNVKVLDDKVFVTLALEENAKQ